MFLMGASYHNECSMMTKMNFGLIAPVLRRNLGRFFCFHSYEILPRLVNCLTIVVMSERDLQPEDFFDKGIRRALDE